MAFWVDDEFNSWPEVVRAGTAAAGLYVRCGAWISWAIGRGITVDAVVPVEVSAMYGTPEWVARLVDVGLWRIEGSGHRDVFFFGRGGIKLNRTADDVEKEKAQRAARNARYQAKKATAGKTRLKTGRRRSQDATQDESQDAPPSPPSPTGKGKGGARASPRPGHQPTCPYQDRDPTRCSTCASERLAADPHRPTAA